MSTTETSSSFVWGRADSWLISLQVQGNIEYSIQRTSPQLGRDTNPPMGRPLGHACERPTNHGVLHKAFISFAYITSYF